MVEKSLLDQGVKRKIEPPAPDIMTCKEYKPGDVCRLGVVANAFWMETQALFLEDTWPGWVVSGYRTNRPTTPHAWGDAFDVKVGTIKKQVEFIRIAVMDLGLFKRGGLYVRNIYKDERGKEYVGLRNTCHIDNRDSEWMKKYNGTQYWVCDFGKYTGYNSFSAAVSHALSVAEHLEMP